MIRFQQLKKDVVYKIYFLMNNPISMGMVTGKITQKIIMIERNKEKKEKEKEKEKKKRERERGPPLNTYAKE